MNAGITSLYEWQLRAYMELYDKDSAELIYCLVDATPEMVTREQESIYWRYNKQNPDFQADKSLLAMYQSECKQIETNLILGDKVPKKQRIKRFLVKRDLSTTGFMYHQIDKANNYFNTLEL